MVFAKNISYKYIKYYLAMIGKGFLILIRSHYPCQYVPMRCEILHHTHSIASAFEKLDPGKNWTLAGRGQPGSRYVVCKA